VRVFAFVAAQKADFPVRTLCRVCKVSTSGFYAYAARKSGPPRPSELARAEVARRIARVHKSSRRRYGSPRVTAQLAREGILVNHKAGRSRNGPPGPSRPLEPAQDAHDAP
jgi:putative transposase